VRLFTGFWLAFLVTLNCAAAGTPAGWQDFVSPSGYRLSYPGNWFRSDTIPTNLMIASSKKRLEGTIIPGGAQMIVVHERPYILGNDYVADFEANNPGADKVLGYSMLDFKGDARDSCTKISVLTTEDEIGPNAVQQDSEIFCRIGKRLFVITLTYWQTDGLNTAAYETAMKIARSIRLN